METPPEANILILSVLGLLLLSLIGCAINKNCCYGQQGLGNRTCVNPTVDCQDSNCTHYLCDKEK